MFAVDRTHSIERENTFFIPCVCSWPSDERELPGITYTCMSCEEEDTYSCAVAPIHACHMGRRIHAAARYHLYMHVKSGGGYIQLPGSTYTPSHTHTHNHTIRWCLQRQFEHDRNTLGTHTCESWSTWSSPKNIEAARGGRPLREEGVGGGESSCTYVCMYVCSS